MIRLVIRTIRVSINAKLQFFNSNQTDILSSRQQMLEEIAKKLNIDIYPSIIEKDKPTKAKKLTNADKLQLGLYIPHSPFNHRLSKHFLKQYLPHVTKQLYIQQKKNLQTYFRILQNNLFLENKRITLDKYVNLIYKDIYARYLVSKGVGVEWNGFFADRGVMNECNVGEYDIEDKMFENFTVLLDFIQNQSKSIKRKQTMGMYSHKQQKFIHTDRVEIQKIKKLGYYFKAQFTQFGQFGEQFRMLQQKNGKAYLLIFVEQLEKLINPNAISAIQGDKYIVLRKFTNQNELEIEYLMMALECYRAHQKYFKDREYEKHSTFDGKYLVGMKVMGLPVIPEIAEYKRPPNCYIVNSNCHIGDFERINASNIPHLQPFISEKGEIIIDDQSPKLMINDLKLTNKLEQLLAKRSINFMDFYDTFDDEVYYDSQTKNKLHFRTGFSYYIDVQGNQAPIIDCLKKQNSIISESKITVPTLNIGKKPRERRRFRKERINLIEQITEHYSLEQALTEINTISLSSLSQSVYSILFFMKDGKSMAYDDVLSEQEMEKMIENELPEQTMLRIKNQGIEVEKVYANENIIQALIYLKNVKNSKQILNIIIEPQSQTQVLVPYALHLNYIINKQKKKKRGTRDTKMNINLIKLHPTFEQKTRSLDVKALIEGAVKSNGKQQYGLGFQALRLWTAKNDHLMGDRVLTEIDINTELVHGTHIRRVYWDLLSLMPQKINQQIQPKLYLNKFMLDSIDCFISHMEECYKTMNIHKAYQLTNDFYYNIVNQIFVKAIRKRIITYPNHQQNQQHFIVIRRILQLLAVISPLFPFSTYHVSKRKMLSWPEIKNLKFYQNLLTHNEMIKTRVNIINKLELNSLRHANLYIQTLKEPFTQRDLQLFFDIDKVTTKMPDLDSRKCSARLPKTCVFTDDSKAVFFVNQNFCIRCDSKSTQTEHLCSICVDYLQQQIGQPFKYFPVRQSGRAKIDNL